MTNSSDEFENNKTNSQKWTSNSNGDLSNLYYVLQYEKSNVLYN